MECRRISVEQLERMPVRSSLLPDRRETLRMMGRLSWGLYERDRLVAAFGFFSLHGAYEAWMLSGRRPFNVWAAFRHIRRHVDGMSLAGHLLTSHTRPQIGGSDRLLDLLGFQRTSVRSGITRWRKEPDVSCRSNHRRRSADGG